MYASLKTAHGSFQADDGGTWFVQKDERSTAEIEREVEYSTLFALIRVLNPLRMSRPESRPRVMYLFTEMPPDPVREAVASAGGHLIHASRDVPFDEPWRAPEDLVEHFLPRIARTVAAERKLEFSYEGLDQLEQALAHARGADEATYWKAVFDLGAFAGETLRQAGGERWIRRDEAGVVPFAFACTFNSEPAVLFLLAKAMKFLANGPEDSLTAFVGLAGRAEPKKGFWSKLFG
ncbi:hypothetical protein [Nannocystis punicea]|uniref:Uncharacterized protein n=1 Tax=Nannocystis punicea TaxID=2995304 RepID=A0ABY7H853_9BACT|nr:hypothetical protein [Nannocystis poenicansa]WAS95267.1 hypothetical protein O0S08_03830 [Nannocystis poenicansa]